ncbi:MAG: MazG nucleotide pyrophosphohydrolase domain-containing protein [Candidatus Caenarcaniphilales bacterium]|nr:MazG nucleotide pyrophosphohydrolase domain-containing protein [Candidatus Caenarcaniphilales bacterium]
MNDLQNKQKEISELCGFHSDLVSLALGASAETGELCDYIAKYTKHKIPKPGDDMSNLREKISLECADVLVYLLQIANNLEFDLEEVYLKKTETLLKRHATTSSRI